MIIGTCFSSSFQACQAIQHIIGANVAGKRLDGVLPKPCRASEVDQHNVEAKCDKEGIASEEGGWVAGVRPAVRY